MKERGRAQAGGGAVSAFYRSPPLFPGRATGPARRGGVPYLRPAVLVNGRSLGRAQGILPLGHDFGQVPVDRPRQPQRIGLGGARAEPSRSEAGADAMRLQGGGGGSGSGSGGGGGSGSGSPPATPSLTLSDDTYTDSATESRKTIKFNVSVPSGLSAGDYALVNWVKGYAKNGSGTYFQAQLYGSTRDINFSDFVVDSVDADPVYWSNSSARWNYVTVSGGFYATDSPGPARSSMTGATFALQFKIGLYRLADVPTTTTGTMSATAIQERPWQYSVKVSSSGAFSHPAL